MTQYLIGLDNGGTNTKAVIFDTKGRTIASASQRTEMLSLGNGRTERDMEKLWLVNCQVLRKVIESAGISSEAIIGLSFSGHGKGLYLWGKDGKPSYNGIVSTDTRAYKYPEQWQADGTAERVFEKTFQQILPMQPVSLLKWLQDHEPEVIEKTQWVFGVKDYIRYRLTGLAAAEITDMSGSNLVNLKTGTYDKTLLEAFGLEAIDKQLPPLKYATDIAGYITEASADLTGLKVGMPVAAGMFDIDASAIAMAISDSEHLCIIAGTWSINEYISKTPVVNKSVMMNSLYCIPGYYLIEECSPTSAGNNEWFIDEFMGAEVIEAKKAGVSIYAYMNAMVAKVDPLETDILFMPHLYGSNYNPRAKASLIGMDSSHSKGQIARAVYEGIAFSHRIHVEKLLANNPHFTTARLGGGVVKSDVWVQIFADVLNMPIEIIDTEELGAFGAAMAAGVAAGVYQDLREAAKILVTVKKVVYPIAEHVSIYEGKFQHYKKAENLLSSLWS